MKPQLMMRLAAFNQKVGKLAQVEEAVENVKPWNPRLKPVKNRYESQFLLFAVPNDIAAAAVHERNAVEPAPGEEGVFQEVWGLFRFGVSAQGWGPQGQYLRFVVVQGRQLLEDH